MFNIFKKNKYNSLISNFEKLTFSKNVNFSKLDDFLINDVSIELLDKVNKLNKQKVFSIYYNFSKISDELLLNSSNVSSDLFVVYSGLLGREFSKTLSISLSNNNFSFNEIIFQVLSGCGYFILEDLDDTQNLKVVKVMENSIVIIPKNYSFVIINSSFDKNLVCQSFKKKNLNFKISILSKNSGATLYYTEAGFIRNNNLSPMYHLEDFVGNYLEEYDFEEDLFLYDEFIKNPGKFNFLKE